MKTSACLRGGVYMKPDSPFEHDVTWICWNRGGLLAARAASFSAMEALRVRTSA